MSSETRRDAPQSAGASLSAYATSCCGADDLCTRSIAALVEAPAVAMGCAPPSHDLLPVPDRIIPSNELTPPSPPPNA
jgi:hypothetical protein